VSYIDESAARIRKGVPRGRIPRGNTELLFRLYALLSRVKGERVSAEDVHDAWSIWMSIQDPSHPSIRPFDELDPETRKEDEPFVAAIRHAVRNQQPNG
jgi:hypothetical protein